ncbi:unnamed protein product [Ixodes pacificus]
MGAGSAAAPARQSPGPAPAVRCTARRSTARTAASRPSAPAGVLCLASRPPPHAVGEASCPRESPALTPFTRTVVRASSFERGRVGGSGPGRAWSCATRVSVSKRPPLLRATLVQLDAGCG